MCGLQGVFWLNLGRFLLWAACFCLYCWWVWLLSPLLCSRVAFPHHRDKHNPALPEGLLLRRRQHQVPAEERGNHQRRGAVCCRHPHRHPRGESHLQNLLLCPSRGFLAPAPLCPANAATVSTGAHLLCGLFDFCKRGVANIYKWKHVMRGMRLLLKPVNRPKAVWASLWASQELFHPPVRVQSRGKNIWVSVRTWHGLSLFK